MQPRPGIYRTAAVPRGIYDGFFQYPFVRPLLRPGPIINTANYGPGFQSTGYNNLPSLFPNWKVTTK